MRRRVAARVRALLVGVLASVLLAGCAQSVDPIERLGKKAAQTVHKPGPQRPTAATYHRWGLPVPLAPAPRPPARRPVVRTAGPGLTPVVDRVPTRDNVVFLTYDEGAERDPRLADMVRQLRLPVSMFLTGSVTGPRYAHLGELREVGATLQNHTLDHTSLRGLPYAGQRAEICGQQDRLTRRFGVRPRFLRPPYGRYDTTTLRAAADCGLAAVVLWHATADRSDLRYRKLHLRLHAGDILTVGPAEPMDRTDPTTLTAPTLGQRTTRLLRAVQAQGFTVGRLEDYL